MTVHQQRALALMQQNRYERAEAELRKSLGQEPDDGFSHSLLAICLSELGRHREAEKAAATGIEQDPDSAYAFYAASIVSLQRGEAKRAKSEIDQAIAIDPYDPQQFLQRAAILISKKEWKLALADAEAGLELDPEDTGCINVRAMCLNKLGRKGEGESAMRAALAQSPEDAWSHANLGWSLLSESKPDAAMPHFREALRLEPEMEWARVGIVEAMKGKFFVYRWFLSFFIWMGNLKGQYLWGLIIGGYVGYQVCLSLINRHPNLSPFLIPVIVIYLAFVVMTWVSSALFNLVLRFNKFGRMALSDEETRTSSWVGLALLLTLALIGCWLWTGSRNFLRAALATGLTIPVISTYYSSEQGWPREAHRLLAITLVGLSTLILIGACAGQLIPGAFGIAFDTMAILLTMPTLLLAFFSQFGVNFLVMATPRKGTNAAKLTRWVGFSAIGIACLIIAGFFGALLFTAAVAPEAVERAARGGSTDLVDPPRMTLVPADEPLEWRDPAKVERLSQSLADAGFHRIGDYRVKETSKYQYRIWLNKDSNVIGELGEINAHTLSYNVGLSAIADQQLFIHTDQQIQLPNIFPEQWQVTGKERSASQMLADITADVAGKQLRTFQPAEVIATFQNFNAQLQDRLLSRGGLTQEEIAQLFALNDETASEASIREFQSAWKQQAFAQLEKYFRDQLAESNPELAKADLVIVNRFLSTLPDAVIEGLPPASQDRYRGDFAEVEETDRLKAFAQIIQSLDQEVWEMVEAFETPVPTEIYAKRR